MLKKKKQHYIPIFYLKYFIDPDTLNNKDPFLWVFDKKSKKMFAKSPKNIAYENYYYSYEIDNEKIDYIENNFSEIENDVSYLFKKILDDKELFKEVEERYLFSKFICSMYNRTPKARKHDGINFQNIMKSEFMKLANSEGGIEKFLVNRNKECSAETFLNSFNKIKVAPEKHILLELMIKPLKKMIPHFAVRNWTFLIPENESDYFITSDHPVFPFDSNCNYELNVPGFIEDETDIYFPISPNICLLASFRLNEEFINIEHNDVRWINNNHINWAERYIFTGNKNFIPRNTV